MSLPAPVARRASAALLVALVAAGLGLQVVHAMAAERPDRVTHLVHLASYFTDHSNALAAFVVAALALGRRPGGRWWPALWLAALCAIVVTAVVFAAVLLPAAGRPLLPSTVLLHLVAPPLAVALLLGAPGRPRPGWPALGAAVAWPVTYLAWILTYGAATGWFPYPFVDAGRIGWAGVAANAGLLAVLLVGVGAVVVAAGRRQARVNPAGSGLRTASR